MIESGHDMIQIMAITRKIKKGTPNEAVMKKVLLKQGLIITCIVFALISFSTSALCRTLKHIVLIETMPVPAVLLHSKTFQSELKKLGYEEGLNFRLTILKPNGDRSLAEKMLRDLIASNKPDLVATVATLASQTAAKLLKNTKIPILFFLVSDPVGSGIIEKMGVATGTNITGRVNTVSREAKIKIAMQLVSQIAKTKPVKFGFIYSSYPSSVGDYQKLMQISQNRNDLVFVPQLIAYQKVPDGIPDMIRDTKKAISILAKEIDFWWEPQGPLGEVEEYTRTLIKHSTKPIIIGQTAASVKRGALMHISPNFISSGKEVAMIAHEILEGKDPGKIPVVPPSDFTLGINLTTAIQLRIVIPPEIMELAGKNIYR